MADGRVEIQIKADDKELRQAEGSMKKFTGSILAARAIEKVFQMVANSLDAAIKRFDTLNQFPRTLEAVGFGADESERAINRLSDGIQGLPTRLDEVADTAKRLAMMTKDIDLATDLTLALNNAFLANGTTTADASRGLEQYLQMLSTGKVDMQSWRSLTETMGTSLQMLAEEMGFTGASAAMDLYAALRDGIVTFDDFNAKLIEMDQEVGGFADRALIGSEGIATSWQNIQTAFAVGTERIIRAFDDVSQAITGNTIAQNMVVIRNVVRDSSAAIADSIRAMTPLFKGMFTVFSAGISVVKALDFVIIGLVASFLAFKVINQVETWMTGFNTVVQALAWSTGTYNDITSILSSSLGGASVAQKAFGTIVALATGQIKLATLATTLLTKAKYLLLGPVTLVAVAIGALVAVGVGLYKWLMRTTPEVDELSDTMTEAADSSDSLAESTEDSARAYEKRQDAIEVQTSTLKNLIDETYALTDAEGANAAEKKILEENVASLNDQIEGLNLAYDEETGKLSQSAEAIHKRVEAMEAEEKMIESQTRLMEISDERAEIELQLEANTRLMNEAQAESEELSWNQVGARKELNERTSELEETNEELRTKLEELGVTEEIVTQQQIENAQAVADAEVESKERRVHSMNELTETQAATVEAMQERYSELRDTTINNFEEIEQNVDLTMQSVKESLESNIETMRDWSENMQILSNKGVDEGMLLELQRLGPEGAPLVAELVNASDEELAEMEGLFAEAGKTSKDVMFDELGVDESDMIDGIPELVTNVERSWADGLNTSSISKALPEEIEKSRPEMVEAGNYVALGAAEGLEQGTADVRAASGQMGEAVTDEFGNVLGIRSPSTVFRGHGADVVAGLKQGIDSNRQSVVSTIQQLGREMNRAMTNEIRTMNVDSGKAFNTYAQSLNKAATSTRTQMNQIRTTIQNTTQTITRQLENNSKRMSSAWQSMLNKMQSDTRTGFNRMYSSINTSLTQAETRARTASQRVATNLRSGVASATDAGRQMGNGFRNGLASTEWSILNLARGIANRAASSIRSALKIQSPSKVTYGLGEFFGEGFIDGMDSMIQGVEKAGTNLAESAIPRINPMSSFGQLGYATAGTVTNNSSRNMTIHIEKIENHSDSDIPRILEESAWILDRERGRLGG